MTFYKSFIQSMETHYRSSIAYLAAQYNSGVKLESFGSNDGTDTVRVEIQRMKRLSSVETGVSSRDADGTGSETGTAKFAGNALIARMNKLQKVSWASVTVIPGEEKIIGVSVGPREEKDVLQDVSGYEGTISSKVQAMMEEMNEIILNDLIANVPTAQVIKGLKTDGTADKEIFLAVQRAVNFISLKVDEYKKYTNVDKIMGLIHPDAVSSLGRFKGEVYQGVPELFDTGVKADFQVDGIHGYKEPGINSLPQIATEDVLGIIYDIEGLAVGDPENNKTDFDDKIMGQRYVGTRWNEVVKHFDKERIVLLTGEKNSTILNSSAVAGN